MVNFRSRTCLNSPVTNNEEKKVELNNVHYEVADQFCYLGDVPGAGRGAEASTISVQDQIAKQLRIFYLFQLLKYFHITLKASCIKFALELLSYMVVKSGR